MNGYDDYLKSNKSISFDEALKLHKQMLEEIGTDEMAVELYKSLSAKASRYSGFRSEWVTCNLRRAAATGAFASGHSAEHNGHLY